MTIGLECGDCGSHKIQKVSEGKPTHEQQEDGSWNVLTTPQALSYIFICGTCGSNTPPLVKQFQEVPDADTSEV